MQNQHNPVIGILTSVLSWGKRNKRIRCDQIGVGDRWSRVDYQDALKHLFFLLYKCKSTETKREQSEESQEQCCCIIGPPWKIGNYCLSDTARLLAIVMPYPGICLGTRLSFPTTNSLSILYYRSVWSALMPTIMPSTPNCLFTLLPCNLSHHMSSLFFSASFLCFGSGFPTTRVLHFQLAKGI